jgi:hypothetical protein
MAAQFDAGCKGLRWSNFVFAGLILLKGSIGVVQAVARVRGRERRTLCRQSAGRLVHQLTHVTRFGRSGLIAAGSIAPNGRA